ncbi:MAG: helix-hairpin-helix domain-containing protein [Candidatus Limnocylindrales bacterium]
MEHQVPDWAAVDAALQGHAAASPRLSSSQPPDDEAARRSPSLLFWLTALAAVAVVLLVGATLLVASTPAPTVALGVAADAPSAPPSAAVGLVVDVEGAVRRPGIRTLPPGSRVADAITAAGGYSGAVDAAAAASELDLADPLQDGAKVLVPARGTAAGAGTSPRPSRIDLNHATAAELDSLPGIGPATAAKIITARQQQSFRSVNDLLTRKLVGPATFAKLKDLVTV